MPIFPYKRKSQKKVNIDGIVPSSPSSSSSPSLPKAAAAITKTSANASSIAPITSTNSSSSNGRSKTTKSSKSDTNQDQTKLVFHCQLAHGSPTGLITGFNNVKDLYKKIADCFEISASSVSPVDL